MVWIEILSVWPNDAVKKYPDLIEIGNIFELGKNATIQIGGCTLSVIKPSLLYLSYVISSLEIGSQRVINHHQQI